MTTLFQPKTIKALLLTAAFGFSGSLLAANGTNQPNHGANAAKTIDDIPPGHLRSQLQSLPEQSRSRALHWLSGFSFPEQDVAQMHVDSTGGIYYIDDSTAEAPNESPVATSAGLSAAEAFSLHSKPGAANVLFLDFDGHTITGTAWNDGTADPLFAQAFDSDGNTGSFSANELDQIAEIWHRMAEDFAPFDIDVTTEDPGNFGPRIGRVLMTPNVDANGVLMPAPNAGGVAYVNVFGSSQYGFYSPAFVYSNNLSNFPPFIAEAASHEAGHNLGLSHDGTTTSGYYPGHGSGFTSWGPIMGTGYNDNVSQWSRGEYANANNFQDDIALIIGKTAIRSDDHGGSASNATLLDVEADGAVLVTNPETDVFNANSGNKGIIGDRNDVDVFSFSTAGGDVNLTVTPSWAAWPRSSNGRGTNLDVQATLFNDNGDILDQQDPSDETDANISAFVPAGNYYLAITGVGNTLSPYPDYGSQGMYFISGSITPSEPDVTPPNPNPMTWAAEPAANGSDSISMSATTATDDSGSAVQYYFSCVSGGDGCADSGWISNASYTATGLSPLTSYSWNVKARDTSGNETAASSTLSATTADQPQAPAAPNDLTATDNTNGTATLNWTDVANESSYSVVREFWHPKRRRWQSRTLVANLAANSSSYTDASGDGLYRYFVTATNEIGSASSAWVEVTVTTAGSGGGGGGGSCKGGPKKCP